MSTTVDTSLLQRAAAAAAGHQRFEAGALYVVATPVGNLADITLRALHVLARVDAVACEDTRIGGALLTHFGLTKPLLALHAHNEQGASAAVLERLAQGQSVALISDAGTPAVSDPGAVLVAAATAAKHAVVPLPGASSALAALSAAGDVANRGFSFAGFLPSKGGERSARLESLLADDEMALVLFEAPHRIESLAAELAERVPLRTVTLARELTKQFECIVTLPSVELPRWLAADSNRRRGEFTLVVHATAPRAAGADDELPANTRRALAVLQRELPLKQAVALAAEITGAPRNALYAWALAQRDDAGGARG